MTGDLRPTRYAHCEGHTGVCFSEDGKLIITCGKDGEVRTFQGLDDDDCITHSVGDVVHALAYKFPNIVVATDNNCVQYFNGEDGMPGQILSRFTAHPTCLDVSGKLIAAGGSDMVVRVHDSSDNKETVLEGHKAPVLSVALDPKGEYVASSSCDGSVKIYFLATQSCVKTLPDLFPKSNRFGASSTLCRVAFTPTGSHLLVPKAEQVIVLTRTTWVEERHFCHPEVKTPLSIVTVSKCGSLVAASTADGHISVMQLQTGAPVLCVRHPKKHAVTGLAWNPNLSTAGRRELAFVDNQGQLGTVVDIAASNKSGQSKGASSKTVTGLGKEDVFPPLEVDANMDDILSEINKDDDDGGFPMMEDDFTSGGGGGGDDEDDDNNISLAKIKSQMGFADDEHGTYFGLPKDDPEGDDTAATPAASKRPASPLAPAFRLPELQRCFTPSMTPEHHSQRYMLWNSVGVVKQYNTEEDCSIGVDFHDSSLHHSIHVANSQQPGYSIAALSDQAFVLAAQSSGDTASRVSVQLLSTSGEDWQVELPAGEDCIAVAASSQLVAVASDRRIVRVLSVGGASREVVSIPGPLVCLAAHRHLLLMLYHAGTGAGGDQQIHMLLLNTQPSAPARVHGGAPIPLALSPESFVSWAGFSDEGSPVVTDSEGYVRMVHPRHPAVWTVLLASKDMTKGRSDHHFVLGVSEAEAKVRTVLCRGARYPPLMPPPFVTLLDFKVPVFDQSSEKGDLESTVLHTDMQLATLNRLQQSSSDGVRDVTGPLQEAEVMLQTTLIKLFALSCRSDRSVRALDVCRLMTDRTLQSAMKYAAKLGKGRLAEIVADYCEQRQVEKEEDEERKRRDTQHLHDLTGLPSLTVPSSAPHDLSLLPSHSTSTALANGASRPITGRYDTDEEDGSDGAGGDGSDGDNPDDMVGPTPSAAAKNPLLAAAARRSKDTVSLSLDTSSVAPSKVNPFRKNTLGAGVGASPSDAKKVLEMLDDYRPKTLEPAAPLLRPLLKKRSKAERGLTKTSVSKETHSQQPSIKSKFVSNPFSRGKENQQLNTKDNDSIADLPNVSADSEASKSTPDGSPAPFRDSSMFKSTSAMHLWWADNESAVRGEDDASKDLRQLMANAAMLFKDLSEDTKTKYKKLASANANSTSNGDTDSIKRKRDTVDGLEEESAAASDTAAAKKPKPGSGIAKLAAFACSKT